MLGTKYGMLTVEVMRCLLLAGKQKSCGCAQTRHMSDAVRTHGEIKRVDGRRVPSPEYRTWQMMRNRCINPNATDWKYYGGRGISVCVAWETFDGFLADMGRKPTPLHTLERVDGNGPYCKSNCVWETRLTQARNRKYSSVRAWEIAAELGLSPKTVYHMMWECREKDKGNTKYFTLSPKNEARIRPYMERSLCVSQPAT